MRAVDCKDAVSDENATTVDGAPRSHLSQERTRFEAALRQAHGNITQAAAALGVTKPYAMNLVKRFGLTEWAKRLRAANGVSATGRPRNPRRSCAID